MTYIIYYIIIVNILLFVLMGIDKLRAIKHQWRIKERSLLTFGLFGAGFGGLLSMMVFRHKIRKPIFYIIYILSIFLWAVLIKYYDF